MVEEKALSSGPTTNHDSNSNSSSLETTHDNSGECSAGASTPPHDAEEYIGRGFIDTTQRRATSGEEKGSDNKPEIDYEVEIRRSTPDAQDNNVHRHAAKTRKLSSNNTSSSSSQKKGGAAVYPADHDSEIVSTSLPAPEQHGSPAAPMTGMDHELLPKLNGNPWALYDIVAGVDAVTSWEVLLKVRTAEYRTSANKKQES